jgi:hypothetical protein
MRGKRGSTKPLELLVEPLFLAAQFRYKPSPFDAAVKRNRYVVGFCRWVAYPVNAPNIALGNRWLPQTACAGLGQALTSETIAECIRSGGVGETESNKELLALVPASAAADRNAVLTVESVKL